MSESDVKRQAANERPAGPIGCPFSFTNSE